MNPKYTVQLINPAPINPSNPNAWIRPVEKVTKSNIDAAAKDIVHKSLVKTLIGNKNITDLRFQVAIFKAGSKKKIVSYKANIKYNTKSHKTSIERLRIKKNNKPIELPSLNQPKHGGATITYDPLPYWYTYQPFYYNIGEFYDPDYVYYYSNYINAPLWTYPAYSTLNYWNYFTAPIAYVPTIGTTKDFSEM